MSLLALQPTRPLLAPPPIEGQHRRSRVITTVATVIVASLFIALTAQVSLALPIGPVPITGQTLGVLLVAATLGARLGSASVLAYLAQGASGLPVFAGGTAGWAVLTGPTGGYLAGFLLAALIVGALADRGWTRHPLSMSLAMLLGTIAIYTLGLPRLATFTSWDNVWAIGLHPFLLGDTLKLALAAGLLPTAHRLTTHKLTASKLRDLFLPHTPR